MNKNFVLTLFLLIILLYSAYSLEIGINPAYLNLEDKAEEEICQNVSIYADRDINVTIKDKWTEIERSRKIKDYNLSSENFGLNVVSLEKVFIFANETKEIEICFSGENAGNFYGAVLFESEKGYASIGSWVNLKVTEEEKKNIISLTGKAIENVNGDNLLLIGLSIIAIEGVVLFFLIRRIRKKRPKTI